MIFRKRHKTNGTIDKEKWYTLEQSKAESRNSKYNESCVVNALEAYFHAEKLWADFASIGIDIGKNQHFDALQGHIVDRLLTVSGNNQDDYLDKLSDIVMKCKDAQEFCKKAMDI